VGEGRESTGEASVAVKGVGADLGEGPLVEVDADIPAEASVVRQVGSCTIDMAIISVIIIFFLGSRYVQ
jgi:hypothetical protein